MALVLLSAPLVEPVSLADLKAQARIDTQAEDPLLGGLLLSARLQVETQLGVALNTQTWSQTLSRWPADGRVALKLRPIRNIVSVKVLTQSGASVALDPAIYTVADDGNKPELVPSAVLPASFVWPAPQVRANGIEIAFSAGYGDAPSDVPAPIRQAILLLATHWYETREPLFNDATTARMPDSVMALLAPYRRVRL